MKPSTLVLLLFIFFSLFTSNAAICQNNKKYGFVGRVYHNTTARYNGYYFSNNKIKQGMKGMASNLQDDYTQLLPVDKNELATGSSIPDLDSIIIKLSVVNKLHAKSKWADDCYLLIGESYYMKKDYESALQTFQYIVGNYKPAKSKNKTQYSTKRAEYDGIKAPWPKPKSNFKISTEQKSKRNEALIWLITSYIKLKKYDEAESIITSLEKNQDEIGYEYRGMLEAKKAHLYIVQKKYADAIKPMQYAIALTKDKKLKTRYVYILAQLYQLNGNSDKAIATYRNVLNYKPDYKMQFYANINIAKSFSSTGKTNANEILSMLNQMARDDKYEEFRDQIYYAIAEVYLKQKDNDNAIEALDKSIKYSDENKNQKGLSFLKLGELAYTDMLYPIAKKYYDSTVAFIDKKYENIDQVNNKSEILSNLISQLKIISLQDSLQKLAGMSEKDRDKALSILIAKAQKAKQDAEDKLNATNTDPSEKNGNSTTGWYFYNTTLMTAGKTEFIKKWGSRKSEDNWRRSNKKSDNSDNNDTDVSDEKDDAGGISKETLLADIPLTSEQMKASDKKIVAAYYKAGTIYKDDIKNIKKSIETFELLESRFPGNDFEAQTLYQLYLLYNKLPDNDKAIAVRTRLEKEYPNSTVTKFMQNPDAYAGNNKKVEAVELYYNKAYKLYENKQYARVLNVSDSSKVLYPSNSFAAKFDLLKAFAIAQLQPKDSFKVALTNITKKYNAGDEQAKAKELLAYMATVDSKKVAPKKVDDSTAPSEYDYRPSSQQYVVILFDGIKSSNKVVSDSLVLYNAKNNASDNLKVNTMLLNESKQMILVKQFKNAELAMDYYNKIQDGNQFFDALETEYHIFVIDDKNFSVFFKNKNLEQYLVFFEKNYM